MGRLQGLGMWHFASSRVTDTLLPSFHLCVSSNERLWKPQQSGWVCEHPSSHTSCPCGQNHSIFAPDEKSIFSHAEVILLLCVWCLLLSEQGKAVWQKCDLPDLYRCVATMGANLVAVETGCGGRNEFTFLFPVFLQSAKPSCVKTPTFPARSGPRLSGQVKDQSHPAPPCPLPFPYWSQDGHQRCPSPLLATPAACHHSAAITAAHQLTRLM